MRTTMSLLNSTSEFSVSPFSMPRPLRVFGRRAFRVVNNVIAAVIAQREHQAQLAVLRRLYTDPAEYIDSDHPSVVAFAEAAAPPGAGVREKASLLYKAVRDGIRYNPYVNMRTAETFRASSVLAAGVGYCVGKASLYAAACRVHGIPARVGFADVRNHLTTEKLRASMGTDLFTWHGFTEVFVDGACRKAT